MPNINRVRPSHFDRIGRSEMRRRAETLEGQREDFRAFMYDKRMDEASIDRELHRFDELLDNRRRAADQDEG